MTTPPLSDRQGELTPKGQSEHGSAGRWPKGAPRPAPSDIVQVLMSEEMARRFEARCLGPTNTRGNTSLAGPLLFGEDDLPTYIIDVDAGGVS